MKARQKPVIMTASMGKPDFAWANSLRERHFPLERNFVPAHITLFHHLPPQGLEEIVRLIKDSVSNYPPPSCLLAEVMYLGQGVAYKLHSPELLEMRRFFAESMHGLLIQQDQHTPCLHVTVQNKVPTQDRKKLYEKLRSEFVPRPFEITGLALHYYLDGPWEEIGCWSFRGIR